MTHTWRTDNTITCTDSLTHEQSSYCEHRCGLCNNLIHIDDNGDWVHSYGNTELCHERAA